MRVIIDKALILCIAALAWTTTVASAAGNMRPEDNTSTRTAVFSPDIRTVNISVRGGNGFGPDVIALNSPQRIVVSFDELADDRRYMRYELIHCDRNWNPDGLPEPMYIDGFNQADVSDYAMSQATTVHYVNYRITIPSADMKITASGNYILRVYDEERPDDTLLQVRFSVVEGGALVSGQISGITDVDYRKGHQQIDLCVDTRNIPVYNPLSEITVKVMQNGDYLSERTALHPMRVSGSKLYYEHDSNLIFPAGNEFRRFETVSLRYPGMGICHSEYLNTYYYAVLCPDSPRSSVPYTYDQTQHGAFVIRNTDIPGSERPDTEADYAVTVFTFKSPRLTGQDVYIDGDLTLNNSIEPMEYDDEYGAYTQSLLLKQGSYNYRFGTRPTGILNTPLNVELTEGNFYQTSNQYTVYVYQRRPGELYDRLVATATLNSQ
ncbi:MAG: DUF5103 domain-containing protein [Muribaculaceae bacterium]|nr:DUF5103 domain-containing protein [Muribaculaceae bacterium]